MKDFFKKSKNEKKYLPLGGGGGGATVALDPGTGKDMLCFNSGLVGEPNFENKTDFSLVAWWLP